MMDPKSSLADLKESMKHIRSTSINKAKEFNYDNNNKDIVLKIFLNIN